MNFMLIGLGPWGQNLYRNFNELNALSIVVDKDEKRLDKFKNNMNISFDTSYERYLNSIDAVIIATEPSTHFEIAKEALNKNCHVFVEKPLALTSEQCFELTELAKINNLILFVGHILLYSPEFIKVKEIVNKGELGQIRCVYANRLNFGGLRSNNNVLIDLAPHDLAIFDYLIDSELKSVTATANGYIDKKNYEIATIINEYKDGCVAHLNLSWIHPHRTRSFTIVGTKKLLFLDSLATEKIKIYNHGIDKTLVNSSAVNTYEKYLLSYRHGDIKIPTIPNTTEPLMNECLAFIKCVKELKQPITDGHQGFRVVKNIELILESIKSKKTVFVDS